MQQVQLTAALSGNGPSPDTRLPQESEVHLNFRGTNNTHTLHIFCLKSMLKVPLGYIMARARVCVRACVCVQMNVV